MKKTQLIFAASLLACAVASPCFAAKKEKQNPLLDYGKIPFKLSVSKYERVLKTAQVFAGNNFRLKRALEKLRAGEDFFAVCIGGSVTEGLGPENFLEGYAYQFGEILKSQFAKNPEKVHFISAGLSGTPSTLGLVRYDDDIVRELGAFPDLLVVEFAVNDGGDTIFQKSFEGLLRRSLSQNENCAVIALFAAATYPNQEPNQEPIAKHYGVPCVSVSGAYSTFENTYFTSKQFLTDQVHPTAEGHKVMADCLGYLLASADLALPDEKIPFEKNPLHAPSLENLVTIKNVESPLSKLEGFSFSAGGFSKKEKNVQPPKQKGRTNFPDNFHKPAKSENAPFVISGKMRTCLLCYKERGSWNNVDFGTAEVFVDGKKIRSLDGAPQNGWNNVVTIPLVKDSVAKNHEIKIQMAKGSENKAFTIVALGVE